MYLPALRADVYGGHGRKRDSPLEGPRDATSGFSPRVSERELHPLRMSRAFTPVRGGSEAAPRWEWFESGKEPQPLLQASNHALRSMSV